MKFKDGVIVIFNPTTNHIKAAWEQACHRTIGVDYEPTCTSGVEGEGHNPNGGHPHARALDFRSRDVPFDVRETLKEVAQGLLGPSFLVLLEATHYHIQRNKDTF